MNKTSTIALTLIIGTQAFAGFNVLPTSVIRALNWVQKQRDTASTYTRPVIESATTRATATAQALRHAPTAIATASRSAIQTVGTDLTHEFATESAAWRAEAALWRAQSQRWGTLAQRATQTTLEELAATRQMVNERADGLQNLLNVRSEQVLGLLQTESAGMRESVAQLNETAKQININADYTRQMIERVANRAIITAVAITATYIIWCEWHAYKAHQRQLEILKHKIADAENAVTKE